MLNIIIKKSPNIVSMDDYIKRHFRQVDNVVDLLRILPIPFRDCTWYAILRKNKKQNNNN